MKRIGILMVAALALGACSGDDGPQVSQTADDTTAGESTTTTATTAPDAPAEDTVAYFEAFVGNDPNMMQDMLEHSKEGSPAYLYAQFQIDVATLAPGPAAAESIDVGEDTITISGPGQNGQTTDTVFGDFEADRTGKLVQFSVDNHPIEGRIAGGTQGSANGITVTVRSAYQSLQSNSLTIVVDVANTTAGPFNDSAFESPYIAPDGRQFAIDQQSGLPSLTVQPGATAMTALTYPTAPIGGRLVFKGFLDDFFTEVSVEVPVR